LISILLISNLTGAKNYGLKFNSHNVSLDKRTELNLTPDEFFKFNTEFEISFLYSTIRLDPNSRSGFGYVFRIIDEEGNNVDLLSTPTPRFGLNLVIGKTNTIVALQYPKAGINNWFRLRIKFLLSEDEVVFYTPDTFYVQKNVGLKKNDSFKIIFGANDYKQFTNTDVPSMAIKDIEIYNNGKLKYKWPLDEKEGNFALDKIQGKKAKVLNPNWILINHQNWKINFQEELKEPVFLATDSTLGIIYLVGHENLYKFSASDSVIQKIKYKEKSDFFSRIFNVFYNSIDQLIYCYLPDKGIIYTLNPNSAEWSKGITIKNIEPIFRHHNFYFDVEKNQSYFLGGYGLHKYKNKITRIDLSTGNSENLPTNDSIYFPRYLAGLGALNDTLYILGGYGSKTGNQLINPHSYFDMFGYSVRDEHLFKKFEVPHVFKDMIVGNSMWIDKKTRDYYALVYSKVRFENELQLIRGNLEHNELEMVGNKIPFKFLDIRSNTNLFCFPTLNKLFAYISYSTDSTTQVAIYSIENPPNNSDEESLKFVKSRIYLVWIIPILVMFLLTFGLVLLKRRKKSDIRYDVNTLMTENKEVEQSVSEIHEKPYRVIFFGGFQVFNKMNEDITRKFSPVLKELYLLILLNSFKNNKGVSSEKISEVLWYGKDEKSARNNRAVNINKLRILIEEIGDCELSHKTDYWKINIQDSEINYDYADFLNITTSKKNITKQKVNQLIKITNKGPFLLDVHYDWLDDFKAFVSDSIVDTLVKFGQKCNLKTEAEFVIHLADTVFNFDSVNEEAMVLKCKAQFHMGKHSIAKATYEKFFKEYLTMYGQEYDKSYLEIIELKD
jgi:two-component SAPR family response regulator